MTRSWTDLVAEDDAIALIREWAARSPLRIEIVDAVRENGRRTVEALQVSTRSGLGAVAYHTGGILVDDGWLRVLGSGSTEVPRAIDTWNDLDGAPRCLKGLVVADDAIGGFFAWFQDPRTIRYLAPDTLEWEDLGLGYTDWLAWCFTERLPEFYAGLRWPGWRDEVAVLLGDRGLHIYPPLVMTGPPIGERSRRAVPVAELWLVAVRLAEEISHLADGTRVRVVPPKSEE